MNINEHIDALYFEIMLAVFSGFLTVTVLMYFVASIITKRRITIFRLEYDSRLGEVERDIELINREIEKIKGYGEEELQIIFETICEYETGHSLEFLFFKHQETVKLMRSILKLDYATLPSYEATRSIEMQLSSVDSEVDRKAVTVFGVGFKNEYRRHTAGTSGASPNTRERRVSF